MARGAFPGGLGALRARTAGRRAQYEGWEEILPPATVELAEWKESDTAPIIAAGKPSNHALPKAARLSAEFANAPALHWLHAFLIACARREPVPAPVHALFHRLWREEGGWLLETLSYRWLISAAATFRDIGETEEDRRAGLAIAVLFNTLKLTDSERVYAGADPARHLPRRARQADRLALDQDIFALRKGDLDHNLMLYVWETADAAGPTLRPIALTLMDALNADDRTVFHRLAVLREKL
ncbi:MAG: hypothetical protein AAFR53_04315 [Pseudomonadota bacterium]